MALPDSGDVAVRVRELCPLTAKFLSAHSTHNEGKEVKVRPLVAEDFKGKSQESNLQALARPSSLVATGGEPLAGRSPKPRGPLRLACSTLTPGGNGVIGNCAIGNRSDVS